MTLSPATEGPSQAAADPQQPPLITVLPPIQLRDVEVRAWGNANIVESFPELTLPLTYAVATDVYASVYRDACLALGVPRSTVERDGRVFEEMLGLLEGQVFYNLTSWHRVLAMLPGFRLTAGFLEAMMGTDRPGARAGERAAPVVARAARWREMFGMTVRLAWRLLRFEADARRFRASIAALLAARRRAPERPTSSAELLSEFDRFRASAVSDWRAPIMNDLFLMLAHGALRRVGARWLGDDAHRLVNALIVQGSAVSAVPGKELRRIAGAIDANPAWSAAIRSTPPETLRAELDGDPGLRGLAILVDDYLEAWGDRAPRELQLERPSFREDPLPLLRALRSLVDAPPPPHAQSLGDARREVRRRLHAQPLGSVRHATFALLVRATRRHIGWREEMRLARAQVFGVGRRIVRRLGEGLRDEGVLERADDVHYLSLDELRRLISAASTIGDPQARIRLRRRQYRGYAARPRLPARFETRGPLADRIETFPTAGPSPGRIGLRDLAGVGASAGRVRAPCIVVDDPTKVAVPRGCIVVARTTDPGWVPILVGAAGLLVEHGSLLSHSAIVARELGIPLVVNIPGLLELVRTGDVIELDGSSGHVRIEGDDGSET